MNDIKVTPYKSARGLSELARTKIEHIYLDSFPAEERRPLDSWWTLLDDEESLMTLHLVEDTSGNVIGFITCWHLDGFVYVEHFAIDSNRRCGGTGSSALRQMLAMQLLPVVLEVEHAEANEMASRRIGFYNRVGFSPIENFDYIQPPYSEGLPAVPLLLMTTKPGEIAPSDIRRQLHRVVYGVEG